MYNGLVSIKSRNKVRFRWVSNQDENSSQRSPPLVIVIVIVIVADPLLFSLSLSWSWSLLLLSLLLFYLKQINSISCKLEVRQTWRGLGKRFQYMTSNLGDSGEINSGILVRGGGKASEKNLRLEHGVENTGRKARQKTQVGLCPSHALTAYCSGVITGNNVTLK